MAFVQTSPGGLSARLQRASDELRALETLLASEQEIDPRVLLDFREAVNYVRHAAWVTQQWLEKKREDRGAPVLPLLTAERVRITTNLARSLTADLDSAEVTRETGGIGALAENVERLWSRLRDLHSSERHE